MECKLRSDLLLIPMLLSGSLLVTPVKDTVWWNTPGGQVLEHRDEAGASCSLMLYNDDGSIVFEWRGPARTQVTAVDWNWQFPEDSPMPIAMQVGDIWLSDGADSAVIQAVGHGNTATFTMEQPVENLLRTAEQINVQTTGPRLSLALNHARILTLLERTRSCRDATSR